MIRDISDNIFRLTLIEWTNVIRKGGAFRCGNFFEKTYSAKKRKRNYIIHNPNIVEDTVQMLLDILIQANEKKVERKLREMTE